MPGTTTTEWPELSLPLGVLGDTRIAANLFVRSAMFSTLEFAGGAARPAITEPLPLAAIAPYRIKQVEGARLSQSDADLFFWLLSRAYRNGAPKGSVQVYFKCGEALTALGRARGGKTDALLGESLLRLSGAVFVYELPGVSSRSRLLTHVERFDNKEKPYDYKVTIAGGVAELLDGGEWLTLPGKVREKLAGDPLARGLHAFYASHKSAFPMLPSTLKGLMGRETMQDSKWRTALENALAKVKTATGWPQCELVKEGSWAGKVAVRKRAARRPAKSKVASSTEVVQNPD